MNVIKGLYKHFKGRYYLVTDVAVSCDKAEKVVIYHPLNDMSVTYTREVSEFLSEIDPDREDNVEGQEVRFKFVSDLWDIYALKSFTTAQLLKELGKRSDSPLQGLDVKGLYDEKVKYVDYVYAYLGEALDKNPKSPTYNQTVTYLSDWVAFSDKSGAEKYKECHKSTVNRKIYKRVFIEED